MAKFSSMTEQEVFLTSEKWSSGSSPLSSPILMPLTPEPARASSTSIPSLPAAARNATVRSLFRAASGL